MRFVIINTHKCLTISQMEQNRPPFCERNTFLARLSPLHEIFDEVQQEIQCVICCFRALDPIGCKIPSNLSHCPRIAVIFLGSVHSKKFLSYFAGKRSTDLLSTKIRSSYTIMDGELHQKMVKSSNKSTKVWCSLGRIIVASKAVLLFGATNPII